MRICITGASGWLGSRLAQNFANDGHQVLLGVRSSSSLQRLGILGQQNELLLLDRCDKKELSLRLTGIDCLIHTSACYGRNSETCATIVQTNCAEPLLWLEAAQIAGVARTIVIGTALPKETSPYALSKNQFVDWCRVITNQQKAMYIVVLAVENFYGPGDDPNRYTGMVVRAVTQNRPLLNLTIGTQKRDFVHIDDVVSAVRCVAKVESTEIQNFQIFPVGSGLAVPVRSFAETARRIAGANTELRFGAIAVRGNEPDAQPANLALMAHLGWAPTIDLERGLTETITEERTCVC